MLIRRRHAFFLRNLLYQFKALRFNLKNIGGKNEGICNQHYPIYCYDFNGEFFQSQKTSG